MSLWILVPVKPFSQAKSRLSPHLSDGERRVLASELLERTLQTIRSYGANLTLLLVSRDPEVAGVATRYRARFVPEPLFPGATHRPDDRLNRALTLGASIAAGEGATSLLILPTDLPLLTVADIRGLVDAGQAGSSVVLSPSDSGGTNGLLLTPPDRLTFSFGDGSFERHRQSAQTMGLTVEVVTSPGLAFDLDQPDDLVRLQHESDVDGSLRFLNRG